MPEKTCNRHSKHCSCRSAEAVYQVLRPTVRHAALRQMLACYVVQLAEVGGIFQSGIQGSMWDKSDGKDTIMIATHVDDSIVTGSSPEKLDAFINRLESRFDATAERT